MGDALFDEFGNIIKQGRGIHLNKEGYRIWAEAIPLSIFKTYDSGLRMYKDLQCTDEDIYDDSDKQNPFYTMKVDNVRRSKTKTMVRYVKNIGKTQVLFAIYASNEYNVKVDVWSVGVLAFYLLFGTLPFSVNDKDLHDEIAIKIVSKEMCFPYRRIDRNQTDMRIRKFIVKALNKNSSERPYMNDIVY